MIYITRDNVNPVGLRGIKIWYFSPIFSSTYWYTKGKAKLLCSTDRDSSGAMGSSVTMGSLLARLGVNRSMLPGPGEKIKIGGR
jgi:hypothetical protein